jgi:dethiobiotin synthetase
LISDRKPKRVVSRSMLMIVGTDTGVGKTWVGCALARRLRREGHRVIAIKPVETGCFGGRAEEEDGVALALATGQAEPPHALLRFRDPVAPPEAADREARAIDLQALVREIREYAAAADFCLVEGAGGLLSPLTWEHSAVDLARAVEARLLLVSMDRLGTINHTLTSLKIAEINRLDVTGVVLTAPRDPDSSTGTNAAAIARVSGQSRILRLPRVSDPEEASKHLEEVTGWLELV